MVRLLLILIQCSVVTPEDAEVQAYGHIFFQPGKTLPTQVNPKIVRLYRHFDLSILTNSLNLMTQFEKHYGLYCGNMTQATVDSGNKFKTFKNIPYSDSKYACAAAGLGPLIIETRTLMDKVTHIMRDKQITQLIAPVTLGGDFRLYSNHDDNPMTYLEVRSCRTCVPDRIFNVSQFRPVQNRTTSDIMWVYELGGNTLYLFPVTGQSANTQVNIMCAPVTETQSQVLKVVSESCTRDQIDIARTNEMLKLELTQITGNPKRSKRSLAIIAGGLLGVDLVSSMLTGQSALSGIGQSIAHTFGIATYKDLEMTRDEIQKHAIAIKNISLNQVELLKAQKDIRKDIHTLNEMITKLSHHVEIMYGEIDVKTNMYRMQDLIQQTLLKIVVAIQAAKNYQTSPYIFGQVDLFNITTLLRSENIPVTASINDVVTSLVIVDRAVTFIIAVPIINKINQFHFYHVLTLPVFKNEEGYRVLARNKYLAINAAEENYILISQDEYETCIQYPFCTVTNPIQQLDSKAVCEIKSLKARNNLCRLERDPEAQPSFFTFMNRTYYSVPRELEVRMSCTATASTFHKANTIVEYGFFDIPKGCDVTVHNGFRISPGYLTKTITLTDNNILNIFTTESKYLDQLNFPTTPTPAPFNPDHLTLREVTNIGDGLGLIFHTKPL